MSRSPVHILDAALLQAEMRQILPSLGPHRSQHYRDLRAQNQDRVDAALRRRQRPTRVS